MPRERRVQPAARAETEEESFLWSLRPQRLGDYIGQASLVENLRIAITAAKQRGEPLEHVLLHGPPGLGKTTLAHIIAREMETQIVRTSGPALEKPKDLVGILSNLETGEVLFIDEIHRLPHAVEEYLYSAMEDFKVDIVLGEGASARPMTLRLKRYTIAGATTRAGLLTPPLRDRFGLFCHLDFYTEEELAQVVRRSASLLQVPIEEEGALEIARRSRGTPRIANRLLRRVRDYSQVEAGGGITCQVADTALSREGIDALGLDALDRRYLMTILENYDGGPVGIEALAATLNEEADSLVEMVEPFLLKRGFLIRTATGRRASDLAREHLGLAKGARQPQARLL